jgi:hypothetical protein
MLAGQVEMDLPGSSDWEAHNFLFVLRFLSLYTFTTGLRSAFARSRLVFPLARTWNGAVSTRKYCKCPSSMLLTSSQRSRRNTSCRNGNSVVGSPPAFWNVGEMVLGVCQLVRWERWGGSECQELKESDAQKSALVTGEEVENALLMVGSLEQLSFHFFAT